MFISTYTHAFPRSNPVLLATSVIVAVTVFFPLLTRFTKKGGRLIKNLDVVGKLMNESNDKESDEIDGDIPEYDYICVGGGTAGCVLASRLSEDPTKTVLLLEAGGSGAALAFSRIPVGFGEFMKSAHAFQLWTVPQAHSGGKAKFWPRPRMLGGCSSVNAMMFQSGSPEDYDEWAVMMEGQDGAEAWKYENFRKYFLKFEKFSPHPSYPNVDVSVRGAEGPLEVGYFGHLSNVVNKFILACQNVGIKLSNDHNSPHGTLGIAKTSGCSTTYIYAPDPEPWNIMTYIDSHGRRSSTETAYLTPGVLKRPNLKIATHATVTKILINGKAEKRAVGVEFSRTAKDGSRYRAHARKEVILSAGAVHTPHILLLSGVGPTAHLSQHGIPVVHNLPGVGQNLTDHLVVQVRFRTKAGEALNYLDGKTWLSGLRRVPPLLNWLLFGRGPLSSNLGEAAGFIRADDPKLFPPSQFPHQVEEVASGPGAPDLELYATPLGYIDHGYGEVPKGDLMTMSALLLRPKSKGTLSLRSADPFEAPNLDPRYFEATNDVQVLVRGMRILLRIARTEPLSSLLVHTDHDPRLDHDLDKLSDAELERVVRERGETPYHPACSARMAPLEQGGVVDAHLRVYGIRNLRIADASVFPTIVSGHTAAPCIAIAEHAAVLIKKEGSY